MRAARVGSRVSCRPQARRAVVAVERCSGAAQDLVSGGTIVLTRHNRPLMQDRTRRSHRPRWSRSTHSAFVLFRVPTFFLAGRSFFLLAAHCAARHARPHARTLARARTDDRRTNDATCSPQACLTGKLHEGGVRSVLRPPLRRAPLLATAQETKKLLASQNEQNKAE